MVPEASAETVGRRESKRQQTRQRIVAAGLKLFGAQGFDATTIDEIAAAAGVSRRTIFHYFASKDDILLSLQVGLGDSIAAALAADDRSGHPLAALRDAMMRVVEGYPLDELIVLDRLMLSSPLIQSRKQGMYARDEAVLFSALRQHWPDEDETALRLLAIMAIGVARLSLDLWRSEGGTRPLTAVVRDVLAAHAQLFA